MKISILTLFPAMVNTFLQESIVKRAQEKGIVEIEVINIREFTLDSYKTVDDKPYGGGVGMVMKVEPIYKALQSISSKGVKKVVYPSAKGRIFNQNKAQEYSEVEHLVLLAAHYEGIDERALEYVDEEVSLGDFVVTGGEIPSVAIVDAVVRLLPGVLKHEEATAIESFQEVPLIELKKILGDDPTIISLEKSGIQSVKLLEFPQYTRPEEFKGRRVPDVLLSGNHKDIAEWRLKMSFEETKKKRPDLLQIANE